MANRPGEDPPKFRRGQELGATDLSKLGEVGIKKLLAGAGIVLRSTKAGTVVSAPPQGAARRPPIEVYPAKVLAYSAGGAAGPPVVLPGSFQVDMYANGFAKPITLSGIWALPVNDAALPSITDKVTAFKVNGFWYLITSAAAAGGGGGGAWDGKIVASAGDGTYTYRKTVSGGGGADIVGASDLPCREQNLSPNVSLGHYAKFSASVNGLYDEFEFSLDTAS